MLAAQLDNCIFSLCMSSAFAALHEDISQTIDITVEVVYTESPFSRLEYIHVKVGRYS